MKYWRGVAFALTTLLIYLGLSLLGWGLDDLQGFVAVVPRSIYAVIIGFFSLAVGIQAINTPEGISGSKGEKGKLVRRQTFVALVLVIVLYGALFFLPFADRRSIGVMPNDLIMRWVGVILCGLGYTLVFWSGLALGKQYSPEVTIQKDHQLITNGLYRYIRHPRYLGILCLAVGVSGLFHSWIGLAASVPLLGVLILRINDEEALLRSEFGQQWETYRSHSWQLIPYLY